MNPAYKKAFDRILSDQNQSLIVVEKEGRIGTCHLTFIPSLTFQGGLRMNIEAVRVDSTLRGHGIGEWMWFLVGKKMDGVDEVDEGIY